MSKEEIEKLFLAWWQKESPKDIAYASTQNIAAVGFLAGYQAAQQSVQSDKCPACNGKGWFGAQFCEGEECPTCEGTGICR